MRSDSPELHASDSHTMHWASITEQDEKLQPTSIFQSTFYKIDQAAPGTQGHSGHTCSQRHLEFIHCFGRQLCVATTWIPWPGAPPHLHSLVLNQEASTPYFRRGNHHIPKPRHPFCMPTIHGASRTVSWAWSCLRRHCCSISWVGWRFSHCNTSFLF